MLIIKVGLCTGFRKRKFCFVLKHRFKTGFEKRKPKNDILSFYHSRVGLRDLWPQNSINHHNKTN